MITISEAITEAQADEMAEREVNSAMEDINVREEKNDVEESTKVTISLAEYLFFKDAVHDLNRLVGIIADNVRACTYTSDKIRLANAEEILSYFKYTKPSIFEVFKSMAEERGEDL